MLGRRSRILPPAFLAALFTFLLVWSWRRWPDILIDFGRELYIPWQIGSGKVLYRDIEHIFGPLSSYFHAAVFKLFGASLLVLSVSNAVLLAGFLVLVYTFVGRIADRMTAWVSCAFVIFVLAFSQYVYISNYNFISPYSHEATHGVILSVILIYQMSNHLRQGRRLSLVFAGLALGLVFLTKTEIFAADLAAVFTFFALRISAGYRRFRKQAFAEGSPTGLPERAPRESQVLGRQAGWLWSRGSREALNLGLFWASALVPVLGFFAYFAAVLPFVDAAKAVATPWAVLLRTDIPSNRFYVLSMGLDDVGGNAFRAAAAAAVVLLVLLVGILLSFLKTGIKAKFVRSMAAATVLGAVAYSSPFPATRALPILVLLALVAIAVRFRRASFAEGGYRLNSLLLWGVFSACLLAKMLLNARLHHYGFYLALPSVVLFMVMLFHTVPAAIRKRGGDWRFFRLWALAILAVFVGHYFLLSRALYQGKDYPFGPGPDTILAFSPQLDPRVLPTTRALEWLSSLKPEETFVVLPEGVMLNYQAKRLNPTRHISFTYPEILAHGEDRILKDLIGRPPDYFVVIQRDVREYGIGEFGDDPRYGKKIMSWVEEAYAPSQAFGKVPFEKGGFGLRILKRATPEKLGAVPLSR